MPILEIDAGFPLQNLVRDVSSNDTMYSTTSHYLFTGLSALNLFDYAIGHGFSPPGGPRSILDLPCGYGRVARILRGRFPDAELTICDIDRDAVEFCADKFGATGIVNEANFASLNFGRRFDLIWVGSLITHFNKNQTIEFIGCMERHLSSDGLLIMTSHGKFVVDRIHAGDLYGVAPDLIQNLLNQYDVLGYGYEDYPGKSGYGISIISRQWFEGLFADRAYGIVSYLERDWDDHHDVVLIKKRIAR